MAEAVSGVVTLTTFTLAIIRETAIFIRDAKEVDVRIQKLLSKLLDLQDWVELIESTCKTAQAHNELVPHCVSVSLSRCDETLKGVRDTLQGLASRKSGTFYEKVKLKIRTESSKRDVLEAIEDLKHHKSHIKSCMDIWTHQRTANIDRRTSEALPTRQLATVSRHVHQTTTNDIPAPYRTLSNASTILEPVFDEVLSTGSSPMTTHSRRSHVSDDVVSTGSSPMTTHSRRSHLFDDVVSTGSSPMTARSRRSHESETSNTPRTLGEQSEFATVYTGLGIQTVGPTDTTKYPVENGREINFDAKPESVDLHHEISKYKNDETRAQVIRQILERHPRSALLANTKDEYGRTPLCRAAQLGDIRSARTLVEFSADINARDSQPYSVLDHALAQNRESFVAFLIERGVDERNVSKKYRDRLEEIKEAIEYRMKKAAKQKGKGRSKNTFATTTGTRMLAT